MIEERRDRRRVVITGMGVLSPIGNSVDEFWENCVAGRSGIDYVTQIPREAAEALGCALAGEVRNFNPEEHIERKEARRMSRFIQLAVVAAQQALESSGLLRAVKDRSRVGVVLGNGAGGLPDMEEGVRVLTSRGGRRLDTFWFLKVLPNMAAAHIGIQFGIKGYNNTHATACAAATQAMGEAVELIRSGRADAVLSGGAEAGISLIGLAGFVALRALAPTTDPPQRASRPFDARRNGFVASEGAAVLVLESEEHARARGVRVLAEVAGHAATADAYHVVAPCADGDGAARTMALALDDAGLQPGDIDYINAHGTSTPLNDAIETMAIKRVFGELAYQIPISSTKSMVGHALGASGAIESIACVKTLETGVIHPTINYEEPDPECDLDYVPNQPRRAQVRVVLKNSFGFGGQNACLVFRRYEG